MLVVMKSNAPDADIARVIERVRSMELEPTAMPGANRTVIGITGNLGTIDPGRFENLPGVEDVIRITKAHRLSVGNDENVRRAVNVGNATIGDGSLAIIAGPCAVETPEQVLQAAEAVARSGAKFYRGGAFKPRTSPYAFQGLGEEGLKILLEVRERFGLNIVTEAMDERGIDLVEKYGDCIQIGARNMQNFSLLKYAGRASKPVLLKRGPSATLDELLLAAEYIMAEGNEDVILCERGIRTFGEHARNTLDLSIVPAVKRISHLPIIVDPSHGTGHNFLVPPMAKAAVAVGADGVIIEVHPKPEEALCDGAQALTIDQYTQLVDELRTVERAVRPVETFLTA